MTFKKKIFQVRPLEKSIMELKSLLNSSREVGKRERISIFHTDHQTRWIFSLMRSTLLILDGRQMCANIKSIMQSMAHTVMRCYLPKLKMKTSKSQMTLQKLRNLETKRTQNSLLRWKKLRNS